MPLWKVQGSCSTLTCLRGLLNKINNALSVYTNSRPLWDDSVPKENIAILPLLCSILYDKTQHMKAKTNKKKSKDK